MRIKQSKLLLIALLCWIIVCLLIAYWPRIVNGAELQATVRWAVNGMPDTGGFIMYHKAPDQTEWVEVWNVNDPLLREWAGDLPMEEGANAYAMTSFSEEIISDFSAEYTYEWITPVTPGGLPVPTVIIQFGMPQ